MFMINPHPSSCVQQQPLLKDCVLFSLLVDHQGIKQQHQPRQAKDSFAKTSQTQLGGIALELCLLGLPFKFVRCYRAPPVFTIWMTTYTNSHWKSNRTMIFSQPFQVAWEDLGVNRPLRTMSDQLVQSKVCGQHVLKSNKIWVSNNELSLHAHYSQ